MIKFQLELSKMPIVSGSSMKYLKKQKKNGIKQTELIVFQILMA